MAKKYAKYALYFLDKISERFPEARIELNYKKKDPWQLLVVVLLSAQTTDKRVNEISPKLFSAFPHVKDFAQAKPKEVEPYVKSLGFFRNKAKNLVHCAQKIEEAFQGHVPKSREELETLPGIGKKTSAVIVANAFNIPAIAVDTHVARVSRRLGITDETNPEKIEEDLCKLYPKSRWVELHHAFIWHGRRICVARKPRCSECPVQDRCPKIGVTSSG